MTYHGKEHLHLTERYAAPLNTGDYIVSNINANKQKLLNFQKQILITDVQLEMLEFWYSKGAKLTAPTQHFWKIRSKVPQTSTPNLWSRLTMLALAMLVLTFIWTDFQNGLLMLPNIRPNPPVHTQPELHWNHSLLQNLQWLYKQQSQEYFMNQTDIAAMLWEEIKFIRQNKYPHFIRHWQRPWCCIRSRKTKLAAFDKLVYSSLWNAWYI